MIIFSAFGSWRTSSFALTADCFVGVKFYGLEGKKKRKNLLDSPFPHLAASSKGRVASARDSARCPPRPRSRVRARLPAYSRCTEPDPRPGCRKVSAAARRRIRRSSLVHRGMWPRTGSAGMGCWAASRRCGGRSPGFAERAGRWRRSSGRTPRWAGCQPGPARTRTRSSSDVTSPRFYIWRRASWRNMNSSFVLFSVLICVRLGRVRVRVKEETSGFQLFSFFSCCFCGTVWGRHTHTHR